MEKIEELLKKVVYTGVGLVSLTAERLQKVVNEMVSDEKISKKEGEKIVDDFLKNTEKKREDIEKQLKNTIDKFKFASSSKLEELNNRVKILEQLLSQKK